MPGALTFLDQPVDGAVLVEDVMGTDLGNGVAQALQRRGGGRHAGIMQHHHVHGAAAVALIEIGRRTVHNTHHQLTALPGTAFSSASSGSTPWVSAIFASLRATIHPPTSVSDAPAPTRTLRCSSSREKPPNTQKTGANVK